MTIWFDVEDLFEYARAVSRPSGIQRLSYEIYAAAQHQGGHRIGFLRHDPFRRTMRVVDWADVRAIYHRMTEGAASGQRAASRKSPTPLLLGAVARMPVVGATLRGVAGRMPVEVRRPLGEAARAQFAAMRAAGRFVAAIPGAVGRRSRQAKAERQPAAPASATAEATGRDIREVAQPGDVLVTLGAPWWNPEYPKRIAELKAAAGLRYALLIYDLIPLMRPEYCNERLIAHFASFIGGCLPLADAVLTISHATSLDVERWAGEAGLALPHAPGAIAIGTGFSMPQSDAAALPSGLVPGGYALFVSTLEARKNHLLAFRAWRRLLEMLPPERVPRLVFAGRVGPMVEDLMQQLRNSANLDGMVVLVEDPSDDVLAALYRGARFTLFPSLYEGWGLPVSESLAFGKVCLASNGTSVPEAGGSFCLYHDPDSVTEATALYRRAIEEPGLIEGLEQRIAAEYRPTRWSVSAQAVMDQVGAH